jgi:hypothetical protein
VLAVVHYAPIWLTERTLTVLECSVLASRGWIFR